ncbi:MAG: FMN-binding protein [Sulfurovum sp.]|nr:FMN-binding protein [Sulfurovum sp.]
MIHASFDNVSSIKAKRLILTATQFTQIQNQAKSTVRTKIYRYYEIMRGAKRVGVAVLISRKVRSKKATILYAFDNKAQLIFTEIMAFAEPPEFIPSPIWMSQLQKQKASARLMVGKDIPTISGATLSARCVSDAARIARAIYQIAIQ